MIAGQYRIFPFSLEKGKNYILVQKLNLIHKKIVAFICPSKKSKQSPQDIKRNTPPNQKTFQPLKINHFALYRDKVAQNSAIGCIYLTRHRTIF